MVQLKLLKGGVLPREKCPRTFLSAFVSNTRLMGVIGVYVHWNVLECAETEDLHQFFYLDHEESGLESYVSIFSDDKEQVAEAYHSMIGCLGGESIPLSREEVSWLLKEYVEINKINGLPLPGNQDEYKDLLQMESFPTPEQAKELMEKQCPLLESEYQLINYFLMRCLGRDFGAAEFLTNGKVNPDIFGVTQAAALCRNEIHEEKGRYICQSLVETGNKYHIYVTEVTVNNMKVTGISLSSGFDISPQEAAMQLARPEFVSVYDLLSEEAIDMDIRQDMPYSTIVSAYENGRLYMIFNNTNEHVDQKIFQLNGDVFGISFISNGGQLIAAAYSPDAIEKLEQELRFSKVGAYILPVAKFEFKEPILYDFIQSDYDDFSEFLDDLQGE